MENRDRSSTIDSVQDYDNYLEECLYCESKKKSQNSQEPDFVEKDFSSAVALEKASAKFKKVQSAETMVEDNLSDEETQGHEKNSETVVRVGYLSRQNDSIIRPWMKCYCILTSNKFRCYSDRTKTLLVSCLNFQKVDSEVSIPKDSPDCFDLKWEHEVIATFKCQSASDAMLWMEDIQERIRIYQKQKKLKIRKASRNLYKDEDTLTEEEFFNLAKSGDILLMKTSDSKCALQRFVTNSEYDHISMVVAFSQKDIKIFESNADEGVHLYDWEEFQCKFNLYEKITYRKLHHPFKDQIHKRLLKFIKNNIGKGYNFGVSKILRKNSSDHADQNQQEYFCSELVAKAYKYLSLLSKERGSNTYWPVDFTVRAALHLELGSHLGLERVILLKKHLRNLE